MKTQVAIIGGGLAGLALARRLNQAGVDFQLFEARSRFGGRIASFETPKGAVDLGPSWYWPGQPRMAALLGDLGIASFPQYAAGALIFEDGAGRVQRGTGFASMEGSIRVAGGAARIIDALVAALPADRLHLAAPAASVQRDGGIILADGRTCHAQHIALAVPPRVAARLDYAPALSAGQIHCLEGIPTWMAGHAKFAAVYDTPFWRAAGLSGDATSRRGPLAEIHDASGIGGKPAALFGFVGVAPDQRAGRAADITAAALEQLARIFGAQAMTPIATTLQDWASEPQTATALDLAPPMAHPDYGLPAALSGLWDGRLHFASTEMAADMGGFMEGALAVAGKVMIDIGR
jgi:monoamine oxidase